MTEEQVPYNPEPALSLAFIGDQKDLAKLFSKITTAGGAITPVGKNDTNDFHHYAYMTADDICAVVRDALYEQGVFLFVSILDIVRKIAGENPSHTVNHTFNDVLALSHVSIVLADKLKIRRI